MFGLHGLEAELLVKKKKKQLEMSKESLVFCWQFGVSVLFSIAYVWDSHANLKGTINSTNCKIEMDLFVNLFEMASHKAPACLRFSLPIVGLQVATTLPRFLKEENLGGRCWRCDTRNSEAHQQWHPWHKWLHSRQVLGLLYANPSASVSSRKMSSGMYVT